MYYYVKVHASQAKTGLLVTLFTILLLFHLPVLFQIHEIKEREAEAASGIPAVDNTDETLFTGPIHEDELNFPLAYSIIVHNYPHRVIRLVRSIYRPHNHYCIHVDKASSDAYVQELRDAMRKLGDNIYFIPDGQRVRVIWGTMSVLKPERLCAMLLFRADHKWKYWINLTGHEFPLRTNWELVRALTALNGTNLVEAINRQKNPLRFPRSSYLEDLNITWYKGGVHVAVRREFIQHMLENPKAIRLYNALETFETQESRMGFPDEAYFATLNHNPEVFQIPGSFTGKHEEDVAILMTRAKIWWYQGISCSSNHWRRGICIYGINDLPYLFKHPHFFANKFLPTVEPLAYDLLELWFADKLHYEMAYNKLHPSFNLSYYSTHEFAWNHL